MAAWRVDQRMFLARLFGVHPLDNNAIQRQWDRLSREEQQRILGWSAQGGQQIPAPRYNSQPVPEFPTSGGNVNYGSAPAYAPLQTYEPIQFYEPQNPRISSGADYFSSPTPEIPGADYNPMLEEERGPAPKLAPVQMSPPSLVNEGINMKNNMDPGMVVDPYTVYLENQKNYNPALTSSMTYSTPQKKRR